MKFICKKNIKLKNSLSNRRAVEQLFWCFMVAWRGQKTLIVVYVFWGRFRDVD
jgi:hypothetical protein